jgi:hypothetical protein
MFIIVRITEETVEIFIRNVQHLGATNSKERGSTVIFS